MNEILDLLLRFMSEVGGQINELDDEEAGQIAQFLQEIFATIQELSSKQPAEAPGQPALPPGVELLWILSGNEPNAFVNYLRTYPGPGLRELAADPNRLAQVIERLQAQGPPGQPGEDAQGIQGTQFPSSNVEGMKYDPQNRKLLVKFHGENQQPVYQYDGVPPQIFQLLQHGNAFAKTKGKNRWGEWWPMKNPSIGAAVNQFLKRGGYAYQRVS